MSASCDGFMVTTTCLAVMHITKIDKRHTLKLGLISRQPFTPEPPQYTNNGSSVEGVIIPKAREMKFEDGDFTWPSVNTITP